MTQQVKKPRQSGFTVLEMAVVLVIIGLVIGAVTIGTNVQRGASYQRMSSDFVQAWVTAYDRFYEGTGRPPGDVVAAPTGLVNGAVSSDLCGANLRNAMQAAGIEMPAGRAEGFEDRYVYLDGNGNPQEATVCFLAVPWSEPGATAGTHVTRNRNVMRIEGITPAIANLLDNMFDARSNASFGKMRQVGQHNITTTGRTAVNWSNTEIDRYSDAASRARDEDQVVVLNAYIKMSR
ncbi:prepilin-type N-terminal cleavage/methylation domain-containing protein [Undibacterium sp. FT137W]|uniref:Prepilin-type N-terminal cleavage/methylation domain-containing protein n=2 Tax=Undibacterium fentianense TaxID=2828728 RepID=A0A941E4A2_9BURK|nr:prepilin-type N-terminal cleavage/methylation domain-containing protein [Undibacterium fentianense]